LKIKLPVNETCSNTIWNLLSHPSKITSNEEFEIDQGQIQKVAEFEIGNEMW